MANADTVAKFLEVFNAGGAHYQSLSYLMSDVFVGQGVVGGVEVPSVAITEHAGGHPGFYGTRKVGRLFTRLFTVFTDVQLIPVDTPAVLFSSPAHNIIVEATLTGTQRDWWFPTTDPDGFYSKPLSDIPPNGAAISIAACAAFTFDANHLVTNLAIYMDRYHFIKQLL
jgi:hypothetical protein